MKKFMMIAAVLVVILIIYTYTTYSFAAGANQFLPFSSFYSSVKSGTSTYIALNGSAADNLSIASCVTTLQTYLKNAGKSVQIIKLTNYSCLSHGNISSLGLDCYTDAQFK